MKYSNYPIWLKLSLPLFIVLGIYILIERCFAIEAIGQATLVWTLAAILVYVHYTYKIADEPNRPLISFHIKNTSDRDPYHFRLIVENYSKRWITIQSLWKVWSNGKERRFKKFYNKEQIEYVPPLSAFYGHFKLNDWLEDSMMKAEDLEKKLNDENKLKLFLLQIDSWYSSYPDGSIISDPTRYYYFDFKDKAFKFIYRDDFEKAKNEILE